MVFLLIFVQKNMSMKKYLIGAIIVATAIGASGCGTAGMAGDPNAILSGAMIGNNLGGAIGGLIGDNGHGWHGSYRGSAIGSIVGTLAGAAIGNALTTPPSAQVKEYAQDEPTYPPYPDRPLREENTSAICQLRIKNIRFIDDSRDHVISSGEQSKVIFEILNEGDLPAYGVVPVVAETTGRKKIFISPSVMVERILPHNGIKYTATISAGKRIKEGHITLHIAIADSNGQEYDWQDFTLPTRK